VPDSVPFKSLPTRLYPLKPGGTISHDGALPQLDEFPYPPLKAGCEGLFMLIENPPHILLALPVFTVAQYNTLFQPVGLLLQYVGIATILNAALWLDLPPLVSHELLPPELLIDTLQPWLHEFAPYPPVPEALLFQYSKFPANCELLETPQELPEKVVQLVDLPKPPVKV
jgi:hypothetical protein